MATSNVSLKPESKPVTTSGIDLDSFDQVSLYKDVPEVPAVVSMQDALARVGNNEKSLFAIIQAGLQEEARKKAEAEESGWLKFDEDGEKTDEVYKGTLVFGEIINPLVLRTAKDFFNWPTKSSATSADEKKAAKAGALSMIRESPRFMDMIKRRMSDLRGLKSNGQPAPAEKPKVEDPKSQSGATGKK
jgi:hypothetical protein